MISLSISDSPLIPSPAPVAPDIVPGATTRQWNLSGRCYRLGAYWGRTAMMQLARGGKINPPRAQKPGLRTRSRRLNYPGGLIKLCGSSRRGGRGGFHQALRCIEHRTQKHNHGGAASQSVTIFTPFSQTTTALATRRRRFLTIAADEYDDDGHIHGQLQLFQWSTLHNCRQLFLLNICIFEILLQHHPPPRLPYGLVGTREELRIAAAPQQEGMQHPNRLPSPTIPKLIF